MKVLIAAPCSHYTQFASTFSLVTLSLSDGRCTFHCSTESGPLPGRMAYTSFYAFFQRLMARCAPWAEASIGSASYTVRTGHPPVSSPSGASWVPLLVPSGS
jgi:hypothetical protein